MENSTGYRSFAVRAVITLMLASATGVLFFAAADFATRGVVV